MARLRFLLFGNCSLKGALVAALGFLLALSALLAGGCEEEKLEDLSRLGPNEVAVAAVHPPSMELRLTSSLGVTFSRELAPSSARPGAYIEDPPVTLTPEVSGVWKWSSPTRLEFFPDGRYLPNATYTLVVDPRVARQANLTLRGLKVFTFTAEPFDLREAKLYRERVPGERRSYRVVGTLEFNHPVQLREVESHLSLSLEQRGPVKWAFDTEAQSDVVSFRSAPIEPAKKDETLTMTLQVGLKPIAGDRGLEWTVSQTVVIPAFERLVIEHLEFERKDDISRVHIHVSDYVHPEEIEGALSIDPAVENLRISSRGHTIYLVGKWEYGRRYRIRISGEMASEKGRFLERDFEGTVTIGDLEPSLSVAGHGNYLSLHGDQKIAVETVNVDKFTVELDRIHPNNLVPFLHEQSLSRTPWWQRWDLEAYGENIYRRDVEAASKARNEKVLTPISLAEELAADSRGIFRLTVAKSDERQLRETRGVVATDLGILAKRSDAELLVAVVSIRNLSPLSGVDVEVLSYSNQTLARAQTNAKGLVRFENIEADSRGKGPFVIVATRGGDLGFLSFKDTRVPTGDFDVGGIEHKTRGYDAFVYTDRDIYRPGDTTHVAWIIRDPDFGAPHEFPLTLRVIGPDGKRFTEARVTSGEGGAGEYTLTIPEWARTGGYGLSLSLDETTVLGSRDILVEDFIPDRMKVDCGLWLDGEKVTRTDEEETLARPGQTIRAVATVMNLFGPPASGRTASARVTFSPAAIRFPKWRGFTFGDPDPTETMPEMDLSERETDAGGTVAWDADLPELPDYHGWLRATVEVEVSELGGGRAVRAQESVLVSPASHVLGVRSSLAGESDFAEPGKPIPFEAILLDLDGNPVAADEVVLKVLRKRWRTTLRRDRDGRYRYVSEYDTEKVEERSVWLEGKVTPLEIAVDTHGSYRLVLESRDPSVRTTIDFYVYGWGYSPWAMSNPEKVRIKTDRTTYRPGEEIRAEVEAPFEGLLLLTVERERVFHQEWIRMDSNSAVVKVRVPEGTEPNAYLVATLLRPLDSLERHAPARAFGAAPLFLDRAAATLAVEIKAPEAVRPRTRLSVDYRLPGLRRGRDAKVTVAAVDEGILQITEFETPSPLDYFFQQRRLSVGSYDTWALLLPEYEQILRRSSPSGGAAEERVRRKNLMPISVRRVKPVALWSGIVDGAQEWQTVEFDVPEFNGALRIMVVVSSDGQFGSEEKLVRVRDPIVLSPNLPRFLAPGDEILIPVQVYNGLTEKTGEAIPIEVTLELSGPVEFVRGEEGQREVRAKGGAEEVVYFRAQASDSMGKASFQFVGEARGERVRVSTGMAVRPPQPLDGEVLTGVVREGEPVKTVLSDAWYGGTGRVFIRVSPLPVAEFSASLPYLLRYPYGSIEQTTSRSFPLLYFADLARELAPEMFGCHDADYFVNSAIDRIVAMQNPGGDFAFWPGRAGSSANPWATVYATHFLVEASQGGYVVPEGVLPLAIGNLARMARSPDRGWDRSWREQEKLSARAYAAYVLALAGEPERGAMAYMTQKELGKMTPAARSHLAGAFAFLGSLQMMDEILPAGLSPEPEERSWGRTWRSPARDEAIQLAVLAAVDPAHAHVPVLLERLGRRAENGRWRNTQENAFALLALGKIAARWDSEPAPGVILLDGQSVGEFGKEGTTVEGRDWGARRIEIRATGPGVAYYTILDEGIPRQGEGRSTDRGLSVAREYLDRYGQPVDLAAITQGEVIVCRLTLSSTKGDVENVVIADLVAAGLEIENPRLSDRGGFDWIKQRRERNRSNQLNVDYLDVRDDRFLVFTTAVTEEREFFYGLRAVTAGRFVLPPAKAEAMYDPSVRSIRGGGEVTIRVP